MGATQGKVLAELMGVEYLESGGPFDGKGTVGLVKGFPVSADWVKRQNKSSVSFLIRFRRGTLRKPADLALQELLQNTELLQAMRQKKFSSAERKSTQVMEDRLLVSWDYSFKAPSPERVAEVAGRLAAWVAERAEAPGTSCDLCASSSGAVLHCLDGDPTSICPSCLSRIESENAEKERAWEAVEPAPVLGLLAGAAAAVAMAFAWGGLAYFTKHIYVLAALGVGLAIAFTIRMAMRKVTAVGKGAAVVFTIGSVMAGDFFFFLLSLADEVGQPASLDLARELAPRFLEIEFSEASGYLSLLFGVIGAVAAVAFLKSKPVSRQLVRIGAGAIKP